MCDILNNKHDWTVTQKTLSKVEELKMGFEIVKIQRVGYPVNNSVKSSYF